MQLILNLSEFKHLEAISSYNNNYYQHKKLEYIIYEHCVEEYNYYEFFLVENGQNIFIGCSQNGFRYNYITIEFKYQWT